MGNYTVILFRNIDIKTNSIYMIVSILLWNSCCNHLFWTVTNYSTKQLALQPPLESISVAYSLHLYISNGKNFGLKKNLCLIWGKYYLLDRGILFPSHGENEGLLSRLGLGSILEVEEENKGWFFLSSGDGDLLMVGKM